MWVQISTRLMLLWKIPEIIIPCLQPLRPACWILNHKSISEIINFSFIMTRSFNTKLLTTFLYWHSSLKWTMIPWTNWSSLRCSGCAHSEETSFREIGVVCQKSLHILLWLWSEFNYYAKFYQTRIKLCSRDRARTAILLCDSFLNVPVWSDQWRRVI